ncbi:hypothetical protein ABR738_01720 [Streptomyces sp. Edi4]|uniref:TetR-like C-terminal domain-containing protein n=1 Tax=Streptomyces sp. Edi4 TaxID=3162527 RepID=UPI0033056821
MHWGVDQRGHYRTLFGGRMPADLVPGTAHGAGAELLGAVVASLGGCDRRGAEAVRGGSAVAGRTHALDRPARFGQPLQRPPEPSPGRPWTVCSPT